LVQKALTDGRLKFGEKAKMPSMQVDEDPLQISEALYTEPVQLLMVDAMDLAGGDQLVAIPEEEYVEKVKMVYPRAEEELIDFLQRCKISNTEVMLCPRCSAVFDKKATDGLNKFVPFTEKRNWPKPRPVVRQNVGVRKPIHQRLGNQRTFIPPNKTPVNQWVHGKSMTPIRGFVEKGNTSVSRPKVSGEAKKYAYKNNYMGKNPMTRTQWRRHQRQKRLEAQNVPKIDNSKGKQIVEMVKRPLKDRISFPISTEKIEAVAETDQMEDDDLLGSENDFDVLVGVVSILPAEYDVLSEIQSGEDEFDSSELALHKPMCYYVMNNGCLEEQMAFFERPHEGMKSNLTLLFIQAKVNDVGINKVGVLL
jgi:hypothetical protein